MTWGRVPGLNFRWIWWELSLVTQRPEVNGLKDWNTEPGTCWRHWGTGHFGRVLCRLQFSYSHNPRNHDPLTPLSLPCFSLHFHQIMSILEQYIIVFCMFLYFINIDTHYIHLLRCFFQLGTFLRFSQPCWYIHFYCSLSLITWKLHSVFVHYFNSGQVSSFWLLQCCCTSFHKTPDEFTAICFYDSLKFVNLRFGLVFVLEI
jgi:hypothetical protein